MARRRKKHEYCVFTAPSGQTPAKRLICFRTKKAAKRFARRGSYQIIKR